jgi:uncharacterized protein YicC (UPF0701 family)
MAETELIKQLSQVVKETLEFQKKALVSRPEWGTITFKNAERDLQRIFSILNYLDVLPLEYLTDQAATQIKKEIDGTRPYLDQIDKFTIEQANAPQTRDGLVLQIHQVADRLYAAASSWVPFLAYQKGDVTQNIERLSASVSQASAMVEKAKVDIERRSKEIEDIITKAREASAAAGAAVFTQDFDREAKTLAQKAIGWLVAAAVLGGATILIAVLTWFWTQAGLDTGQIWQKVASKVVTLSVLLTATLWCGRIYKALIILEH